MSRSTFQRVSARFWLYSFLVFTSTLAGPALPLARAQLAEDVLKKVKHATVHLHAKLANGGSAEGSGWFVDRGFIITNAHVLNMHGGDKRLPTKIEVTIDGGETTSRTVTAKFRGVQYDDDLMLLEVEGDPQDLPEPLTFNPDAPLTETQTVYVFGYPLGKSLGIAITVSKSSISSLRKENGVLKEIQLNGGIHAGNSGGPVVSETGEVLGVAVGMVEGTTINFAIPGRLVSALVHGKLINLTVEQPYLEGDKIQIPAVVKILDPLRRAKDIRVEYWTTPNKTGKPRPESWTRPEPQEGDSPVQTVDTLRPTTAYPRVDLLLPSLPDENSAYWFRATMTDGLGRQYWTPTISNYRPLPLERREITLEFKSSPGAKPPVEIVNDASFRFQVGTRKDTITMHVRALATPNLLAQDQEGDTHCNLKYTEVTLGLRKNGEAVQMKEKWTPLAKNLLNTTANLRYSDDGSIIYAHPDLRKTEPRFKAELVGISDLLLQSLELTTLPLPHRTLHSKDRVRVQRMLLVGLPDFYVPAHADVKYQYLGVRKLEDRETAFFTFNGDLRPRRGDDNQVSGSVGGSLDVFLDTGEVRSGSAFMNCELDLSGMKGMRMIGTLQVNVRPPAPPAPTNKPAGDVAKNGDKPEEKPGEKPAEKPTENPIEKPAEEGAKPAEGDAQPTKEDAPAEKAPANDSAKDAPKVKGGTTGKKS